jgi:hypothetical protein
MKSVSQNREFGFVLMFSWLLIFPACLYFYTSFDDSNIDLPYSCFKNIDEEDSILSTEKKGNILELSLNIEYTHKVSSLARFPNFLIQLPIPLNLQFPILRC